MLKFAKLFSGLLFILVSAHSQPETNISLSRVSMQQINVAGLDVETISLHSSKLKFFYDGYIWESMNDGKIKKITPLLYYYQKKKGKYKKKYAYSLGSSQLTSDKFIGSMNSDVLVYDSTGQLCYQNTLDGEAYCISYVEKISGEYDIILWTGLSCKPRKLFKDGKVFTTLRAVSYIEKPKSRLDGFRRLFENYDSLQYYPEIPLIAVFDLDPATLPCDGKAEPKEVFHQNKMKQRLEPKSFIGASDSTFLSIYRENGEFYPSARAFVFDVSAKRDLIYCGFYPLYGITVYDYNGQIIKKIGTRGTHLPESATVELIDFGDFDTTGINPNNAAKIGYGAPDHAAAAWQNSPEYKQIKVDEGNQLIYRTYSFFKEKYDRDSLVMLRRKDIDQFIRMSYNKPTYLQIYDAANDYKLIYDEPVPAPFHIIGTDEDGFLWAVTGWGDDGVEVSRYEIER